ncbi:MAG TPA: hypothetical protein VHE33_21290 [Acidobacteriaceae bacterium]|jgi:hypothetical protein|nr:hypothetical protein [Acidobacteriaceae bacterium]
MGSLSCGRGTWCIVLASITGLAIALYDYVTPETGIDQSGGVLLVIVAMGLMLCAALSVALLGSGLVAGILFFLILLDIVGTAIAGYFLESPMLMGAMVIAAIGWFRCLVVSAQRNWQ